VPSVVRTDSPESSVAGSRQLLEPPRRHSARVLVGQRTIGVLNDNNYPSSAGRNPGVPDNNEFIVIQLTRDLHPDPRATH
jgi:hypothetical protein